MSDETITFRISSEEDQQILSTWLTDPEVLNWFPLQNSREIEDAVKIWIGYKEHQSAFTMSIGNKPIGMAVVYLHRYQKLKHQSLFAIILEKDHRGKGYGGQLLSYMIKKAKEEFGLEVLHLEVYEGNPAKRLYERLGFKEYGRQAHFLKEKDGTYRTKINMQMEL